VHQAAGALAARRPSLLYDLALSLFSTTWEQSESEKLSS
jgi:hypothetical protein